MSTDASKPAVVADPISATDAIITGNDQGVTDPRPKHTTKAVNQYGVKVLSGGITADAGFFEAIIQAFENFMSYHPVAVCLCLVAVLHYVAFIGGIANTNGPFGLMTKSTLDTYKSMNTTIGKSITSVFHGLFSAMNSQNDFFALVAAYLWPYLCKPSTRNGILLCIMFAYAYLSNLNAYAILATSFGFFLFAALRNPQHKAIVIVLVLVTCYISADTLKALVGIK